jgi:hypothetical protein
MYTFRKSALAVMFAAAIGGGFIAGTIVNAPSPAVQAQAVGTTPTGHKFPPKLRILFFAGRHLHTANRILRRGKPIYGGHRAAAMKLIVQARLQLKEAAEFATGQQ